MYTKPSGLAEARSPELQDSIVVGTFIADNVDYGPKGGDYNWRLRLERCIHRQMLQAFLMHNTAYEILIASRFLFLNRRAELERLFRGIQPAYGCYFWMRKGAGSVPEF